MQDRAVVLDLLDNLHGLWTSWLSRPILDFTPGVPNPLHGAPLTQAAFRILSDSAMSLRDHKLKGFQLHLACRQLSRQFLFHPLFPVLPAKDPVGWRVVLDCLGVIAFGQLWGDLQGILGPSLRIPENWTTFENFRMTRGLCLKMAKALMILLSRSQVLCTESHSSNVLPELLTGFPAQFVPCLL